MPEFSCGACGQGSRAWINGKGKQGQKDAGQAKGEAEEEAQIDEGEW